MNAVSRLSTHRCHTVRPYTGNVSHHTIDHSTQHCRTMAHVPASSRPTDSLRKPATILLGAAALVMSLVPTGTFKLAEAVPLAAIATSGAIACLVAEQREFTQKSRYK